MKQPSKLIWLLVALLVMLSVAHSTPAKSARHWLRQGNKALAAKDYDAALDAYNKAELEAPESPYLAYNQGIAWYRLGDFNQAREQFERTQKNLKLLRRPDEALAARSEIAIGNSWFREAQCQQDSNLQESEKALIKSIDAYDRCLKLQPKNKNALQNQKTARMLLKKIWAEQAAKKAEQQQKQAKMQELAQRLVELTKRQKEAAQQNQNIPKDGSSAAAQTMAAAASKQQELTHDTHE